MGVTSAMKEFYYSIVVRCYYQPTHGMGWYDSILPGSPRSVTLSGPDQAQPVFTTTLTT
jgi:hypothetical protein